MSTFLHIISFPFWFFGIIFLSAAIFNTLTLKYEGKVKRTATVPERLGVALVSLVILAIAYLLTIQ